GAAFLVLKGFEYAEDFEERYVPGVLFQREYASATARIAGMSRTEAEEYFKNDTQTQKWAKEMALANLGKNVTDADYINPDRVQLFLIFYYVMTGIHGIHILAGLGCILWLMLESYRGMIPPANYSTVEVVSLYWHLVDGIWLFLMPLLYLAGAGLHN